jgi:hypothetical protein
VADPLNPLIVQSDLTVMLETASPRAEEARAGLARFAELVKAPEHIHTYQITPLSLWNAAVAGLSADDVARCLESLAKYEVADAVLVEVADVMDRPDPTGRGQGPWAGGRVAGPSSRRASLRAAGGRPGPGETGPVGRGVAGRR